MATPPFVQKVIGNSSWHGNSGVTVNLNTLTTVPSIVVAFIFLNGNTSGGGGVVVNTVQAPSTAGVFNQRSVNSLSTTAHYYVYWAYSNTANNSVHIITSGPNNSLVDAGIVYMFSVVGVGNTASPWDPNINLPFNTISSGTNTMALTVSTSNPDNLLLWSVSKATNATWPIPAATNGTNWNTVGSGVNNLGASFQSTTLGSNTGTGVLTNVVIKNNLNTSAWQAHFDALTADTGAAAFNPYPWWLVGNQASILAS